MKDWYCHDIHNPDETLVCVWKLFLYGNNDCTIFIYIYLYRKKFSFYCMWSEINTRSNFYIQNVNHTNRHAVVLKAPKCLLACQVQDIRTSY